MLLEVNRLKHLIVDRPSRADVGLWRDILSKLAVVLILDPHDEPAWWAARLPDNAVILPREARYANAVAANILAGLTRIDAQPYETAYVTTDPYAIEEAMGTRVGTILIAEGAADGAIPDLLLQPGDDTRETLENLAKGRKYGLLNELFSTRYGDMSGASGTGFIFTQKLLKGRPALDAAIADNLEVIVGGRYFPRKDARHVKHQLSKRLLRLKVGERPGRPVVAALARVIKLTLEQEAFDIITRVPPKPSKPKDFLGIALALALRSLKTTHPDIGKTFAPDAVRCIREYLPQKLAGGHAARVDNVRGAFSANRDIVAGKRVLLVDDILTSGATAVEIARTLTAAGAVEAVVCPLAIDQVSINYSEDDELPCPADDCEGHLQVRFKSTGDAAFWGCTSWQPDGSGCGTMMYFELGWRAVNERNLRKNIILYKNAPF
jgi:predicted amidophosphoribosyltransferase